MILDLAAALEDKSLVTLKERYGVYIGGKWINTKNSFKSYNPATEEELTTVSLSRDLEVKLAVKAATLGQVTWQSIGGTERAKYLYQVARRLAERAREFAVLETLDGGKPISESRDVDIPLAAAHFFYYGGWADKLDLIEVSDSSPVGVCVGIVPWNFPLLMAAWKIAPALAAGCSIILKPAESTPLSALLLAEVFEEVGVPAGVLNVLTGDGTTGALLVEAKDINKIAFTGSTEVGKSIAKSAGIRRINTTLELGGKGANIIYADAYSNSVEGILKAIFFNQGHVCCAGSRLLIEEPVYDEVLAQLKIRLGSLRVGNPLDKNTDIGAINSKEQLVRIQTMVAQAQSRDQKVWQGTSFQPLDGKGFYYPPTIIESSPSSADCREEIFGPVVSVMSFRTAQEAVDLANNTQYGLACGVWSSNATKLGWTADRLRCGVVWANTYNKFDAGSPFGGIAESGWGREGGLYGVEAYRVRS
jgi:aldehyde dehydrogenase (NAD+)